jgi:hypothetical protein
LGWEFGVGVGLSALLASANLWVLGRVVRGVSDPAAPPATRRGWAVLGALKFLGLVAVAFVLMQSGWVDGLALLLGYAALPMALVVVVWVTGSPANEAVSVATEAQSTTSATGSLSTGISTGLSPNDEERGEHA